MNSPSEGLLLRPIGFLRTDLDKKYQIPPQPSGECEAVIELLPDQSYEVATRDLEGFTRLWLLWWFDRNENWRPTTLPPRGRTGRKGTFATRSPYRPNPLGLSCVPLLGVEGLRLYIGSHDLLADTPILDIKPYIPEFDSFPDESTGWYGEMEREIENRPPFDLRLAAPVDETLEHLPLLRTKMESVLKTDPFPHRTRRIVPYGEGYRLACGDWRIYYRVENDLVWVDEITPRHPG